MSSCSIIFRHIFLSLAYLTTFISWPSLFDFTVSLIHTNILCSLIFLSATLALIQYILWVIKILKHFSSLCVPEIPKKTISYSNYMGPIPTHSSIGQPLRIESNLRRASSRYIKKKKIVFIDILKDSYGIVDQCTFVFFKTLGNLLKISVIFKRHLSVLRWILAFLYIHFILSRLFNFYISNS